MNRAVRNISKILALTVLSTSFQPNFVSAVKTKTPRGSAVKTKTTGASSVPQEKVLSEKQLDNLPVGSALSDFEKGLERQIFKFEELGKRSEVNSSGTKCQIKYFQVNDNFKRVKGPSIKMAYYILKSLNNLFNKYIPCLNAIIQILRERRSELQEYSTTLPEPLSENVIDFLCTFTVKSLDPERCQELCNATIKEAARTNTRLQGFSFALSDLKTFTEGFSDAIRKNLMAKIEPVTPENLIKSLVSHEFGHLISLTKCYKDNPDLFSATGLISSENKEVYKAKQVNGVMSALNNHSQEFRNSLGGAAQFISKYASSEPRSCPTDSVTVKYGCVDRTSQAPELVGMEYFAEYFNYIECNSSAPGHLKTHFSKNFKEWFSAK